MAYRLYTEDVKNGLSDFNDEHYHILAVDNVDGKYVAIVFDEHKFIVAHNLKYEEHNSIHWDCEDDFSDDLLAAVFKFKNIRAGIELTIPFVSVWDGGTKVETVATVNCCTGEIFDIECVDVDGLGTCDEQYIILNDKIIYVYENENGFDYWADVFVKRKVIQNKIEK